jgi:hypothetical protein
MRTDAVVAFVVLMLLGIFAVSYIVVEHREHACAEHCQVGRYAGYAYQGFRGGGKSLRADSCACTNVGSLSLPK